MITSTSLQWTLIQNKRKCSTLFWKSIWYICNAWNGCFTREIVIDCEFEWNVHHVSFECKTFQLRNFRCILIMWVNNGNVWIFYFVKKRQCGPIEIYENSSNWNSILETCVKNNYQRIATRTNRVSFVIFVYGFNVANTERWKKSTLKFRMQRKYDKQSTLYVDGSSNRQQMCVSAIDRGSDRKRVRARIIHSALVHDGGSWSGCFVARARILCCSPFLFRQMVSNKKSERQ